MRTHPDLLRAAALLVLALATPAPAPAQQRPTDHDPRVLPGDVVRLTVWREADWSGDYVVDQFGVVALPLVGDVDVRGETQRSLKARLREAYGHEIRDLSFQLLVLKRIRVTGEVRGPGIYAMEPTMSVADAVVMAGGRGPDGRLGEVTLRRAGSSETVNVLEDTRFSELALETGDELIVTPRSWLSRNAAATLGSSVAVVGILLTLLIR